MGNLKRRGRRPTSRTYLCIDLKSFYASVECVERGLDPMTTLLAVADSERTEKTICLAITPAMKALGIKNRCRVFEIPDSVDYIMATPRMHLYLQYSARIYGIYLKYIAKEDIHVYSVDEPSWTSRTICPCTASPRGSSGCASCRTSTTPPALRPPAA